MNWKFCLFDCFAFGIMPLQLPSSYLFVNGGSADSLLMHDAKCSFAFGIMPLQLTSSYLFVNGGNAESLFIAFFILCAFFGHHSDRCLLPNVGTKVFVHVFAFWSANGIFCWFAIYRVLTSNKRTEISSALRSLHCKHPILGPVSKYGHVL